MSLGTLRRSTLKSLQVSFDTSLSASDYPPPPSFLQVTVPLLGLAPREEERLIKIVGPRYKEKRQVLRLVSDRFPNRIDNKVRSRGAFPPLTSVQGAQKPPPPSVLVD